MFSRLRGQIFCCLFTYVIEAMNGLRRGLEYPWLGERKRQRGCCKGKYPHTSSIYSRSRDRAVLLRRDFDHSSVCAQCSESLHVASNDFAEPPCICVNNALEVAF